MFSIIIVRIRSYIFASVTAFLDLLILPQQVYSKPSIIYFNHSDFIHSQTGSVLFYWPANKSTYIELNGNTLSMFPLLNEDTSP